MIRKTIIYVLAFFIMGVGLMMIWRFLSLIPVAFRLGHFDLDFLGLPLGAGFFFFLGWSLFKRKEFARDLTFWFLLIGLVLVIVALVFIPPENHQFAVHISVSGKTVFEPENSYLSSIIFWSALAAINLPILIFLGQQETKKLFRSTTIETVVSKTSTESELTD